MLKEALEALSKQSVAAAGPQVKEIDPTRTFAVLNPDGSTEIIGDAPPWRKHAAQDLETIVSFAEKNANAAIWYSRDKIVCITDDATRRDRVTITMLPSDQIQKLVLLNGSKPLITQRELLFMLRTVFTPTALDKFPKLIDLLRKVSFLAGSKADSEIGRGKSSVGKSLAAEASLQGELPEQITLNVPVFTNSFARRTYDVQCALEIYEQEQKFQLFPLPGEVEKAWFSAEADLSASLRALIGEGATPVYYGQP